VLEYSYYKPGFIYTLTLRFLAPNYNRSGPRGGWGAAQYPPARAAPPLRGGQFPSAARALGSFFYELD